MKREYPELAKGLPHNPLPDTLEVTVETAGDGVALAGELTPPPRGVERVQPCEAARRIIDLP